MYIPGVQIGAAVKLRQVSYDTAALIFAKQHARTWSTMDVVLVSRMCCPVGQQFAWLFYLEELHFANRTISRHQDYQYKTRTVLRRDVEVWRA